MLITAQLGLSAVLQSCKHGWRHSRGQCTTHTHTHTPHQLYLVFIFSFYEWGGKKSIGTLKYLFELWAFSQGPSPRHDRVLNAGSNAQGQQLFLLNAGRLWQSAVWHCDIFCLVNTIYPQCLKRILSHLAQTCTWTQWSTDSILVITGQRDGGLTKHVCCLLNVISPEHRNYFKFWSVVPWTQISTDYSHHDLYLSPEKCFKVQIETALVGGCIQPQCCIFSFLFTYFSRIYSLL